MKNAKAWTKAACILGLAAALTITGCEASGKPEAIEMTSYEHVYSNPFEQLEEEWFDYGNGDPYVYRHDGKYYLYVSTKDGRAGIKAWESDNLVDWRYAGLVTEDEVSIGAYAPEVVYWNGYFYLYTSPAGRGHYVYRSESPTGPFERMTDNVGMSIDGSVFIDDDGSWTFTHAGTQGIVGVPMQGPAEFGFGSAIPGTFMGHWTEGSMIIKRYGTYYMTLTGNHVFSKGYRINYVVSKDSPVSSYTVPANNPIIISTEDGFNGLGHSSTVMGPDLDSYYIVYHNLVGRSAEGPPVRKMNIDRLTFNGDRMDVLGPWNFAQPVPAGPTFQGRLDGEVDGSLWQSAELGGVAAIVSQAQTADRFTAEYNFRQLASAAPGTPFGLLFGYKDENNYGLIELSPAANRMELVLIEGGNRNVSAEADLLEGTDWTKLHTLRLERGEESLYVYVDGLLRLETSAEPFGEGGKIGYWRVDEQHVYSHTAFSDQAEGSSDFEALKPIPGVFEAVHYLSGADRGFSVSKKAGDAAWRKADGVDIRSAEDGSYTVKLDGKGSWLRYGINVSQSGSYALDLIVKQEDVAAELELLVDDQKAGTYAVKSEVGDVASEWAKLRVGHVELEEGFRTIAVKLKSGSLELSRIAFELTDTNAFKAEGVLAAADIDQMHGKWDQMMEPFKGASGSDAKMYGGSKLWSDYRIDTTVKLGSAGSAGVLFRVTNESTFPDQVADSLMGYYVAVTAGKLELYKHNYDSELLAATRVELSRDVEIPLRIEAVGGEIRIYAGDVGKSEPVISYRDPYPFLQGKVGIRSIHASDIELGDLKVESIGLK